MSNDTGISYWEHLNSAKSFANKIAILTTSIAEYKAVPRPLWDEELDAREEELREAFSGLQAQLAGMNAVREKTLENHPLSFETDSIHTATTLYRKYGDEAGAALVRSSPSVASAIFREWWDKQRDDGQTLLALLEMADADMNKAFISYIKSHRVPRHAYHLDPWPEFGRLMGTFVLPYIFRTDQARHHRFTILGLMRDRFPEFWSSFPLEESVVDDILSVSTRYEIDYRLWGQLLDTPYEWTEAQIDLLISRFEEPMPENLHPLRKRATGKMLKLPLISASQKDRVLRLRSQEN